MNLLDLKVVYLPTYCGPKLAYAHPGDSGFDLRAAKRVDSSGYDWWFVRPGGACVIPTGIKVAVPERYELQVRTRSGSPVKNGFMVANSPGTVDSGYRGEVGVIVYNFSKHTVEIQPGDRIAQAVICPFYEAVFVEVTELNETARGEGAYNSTGIK